MVVAILIFMAAVREFPEHNVRALFTLADLGAEFLPLPVCSPFARFVGFRLGGRPQANGVDPPVGLFAGGVDRREGEPAGRVPRHTPIPYSVFDSVDDLGRYAVEGSVRKAGSRVRV